MKTRNYFAPQGRAAMIREINQQILEQKEKFISDLDAVILLGLHKEFGFGKTRLERAYKSIIRNYKEMCSFYETDDIYPAKQILREIGVDLDKLRKEVNDENQN